MEWTLKNLIDLAGFKTFDKLFTKIADTLVGTFRTFYIYGCWLNLVEGHHTPNVYSWINSYDRERNDVNFWLLFVKRCIFNMYFDCQLNMFPQPIVCQINSLSSVFCQMTVHRKSCTLQWSSQRRFHDLSDENKCREKLTKLTSPSFQHTLLLITFLQETI